MDTPEQYTIAQSRRMLNVDAKSFKRWLAKAGIEPVPGRRDERVKYLSREQVETLAVLHDRVIDLDTGYPGETGADVDLEQRLMILEAGYIDLTHKARQLEELLKKRPRKQDGPTLF